MLKGYKNTFVLTVDRWNSDDYDDLDPVVILKLHDIHFLE